MGSRLAPPVQCFQCRNMRRMGTRGPKLRVCSSDCPSIIAHVSFLSDIPLTGLICTVDLFEVPFSLREPPCITGNHSSPFTRTQSADITLDPHYHIRATEHNGGLPPDTLTLIHGYPVTESSKRTASLFGTKFVEPHKVTFPGKNQKQIAFTLSVSRHSLEERH